MELEIPSRGALAYSNFTYTPVHATNLGMGAIFDRDYYPEFNPGNLAKGSKITIIKTWMQTATRIKNESYAIVYIPSEVEINNLIDESNLSFEEWVNNRTEIDCTSI